MLFYAVSCLALFLSAAQCNSDEEIWKQFCSSANSMYQACYGDDNDYVPGVVIPPVKKRGPYCWVLHNDVCYWGIFRTPHSTSYTQAKLSCEDQGGMLANIETKELFDKVVKYARRWTEADVDVSLWTAMARNDEDEEETSSSEDGELCDEWLKSEPEAGTEASEDPYVFLTVTPDKASFTNANDDSTTFGALCQRH